MFSIKIQPHTIKIVQKHKTYLQSKDDNPVSFRTNPTPLPFGLLANFCGDNSKKSYKLNITISRYEHLQIINVLDKIVL
jgi:hypothetical protein